MKSGCRTVARHTCVVTAIIMFIAIPGSAGPEEAGPMHEESDSGQW